MNSTQFPLPVLPLKLQINILLRAKQYIQARDLIGSPQTVNEVVENGMDVITQICDRGLNETEDFSEILICADMLIYIAKLLQPKLALISFLEQAEVFNFSSKFSIFIQPLKITLSRMPNKKIGNIAWVLKILNSHLKTFESISLSVKKYKNQDQENELSVQNDPVVQEMLYFYNELCSFYEGLVPELLSGLGPGPSTSSVVTAEVNIDAFRTLLRDNLVDLLGPPLVHMNLSWNSERERLAKRAPKEETAKTKPAPKSEARVVAERIMQLLEQLNIDANYFISWIERQRTSRPGQGVQTDDSEDDIVDKNEDFVEPQLISVCCYMYLLYGAKLSPTLLPSIPYSPSYNFSNNMYLVNEFLCASMDNENLLLKGLGLAGGMIELVNSASPFTSEALDMAQETAFLERLGTLMVFCESRAVRVAAVSVFTKYFWAYDARGKKKVLNHLFNTVKDPGIFGHCISQLKECICLALNEKENNVTGENTMQECFLQSNLLTILQPLCALDNGVQTDLIRSCNKIIPMLNLLRYVFIRDGAKNLSGVRQIMPHIEANFLKPLRFGLDLSKQHFHARMEEVKNSEGPTDLNSKIGSGDIEVSIFVGNDGEEVTSLEKTKENQVEYISSALGTLDLLESLWARVSETSTLMTSTTHSS